MIHKELGHRQVNCDERWVTKLMHLASLKGRCKKRFRKTARSTRPPSWRRILFSEGSDRALRLIDATSVTSKISWPGRVRPIWRPSFTWSVGGCLTGR
jgi:hypothetical protein